jgi:hypothetical protein
MSELVVQSINGSGFVPNNLIINPEFTINQRGAASRTASTGYNFDRWYYDGTRLLQGVETLNLRAGTYVVSWEGSSTCEYSLNTAAAASQSGQSYTSVSKGGTIVISSVGSNNLWLRFSSDLTNLTKVMLIQGTQTSAFVARQHASELALCQRYYYRIQATDGSTIFGTGTAFSGTVTYAMTAFPVQMRAAPTSLEQSGTASDYSVRGVLNTACSAVPFYNSASLFSAWYSFTVASGLTAGQGQLARGATTNAFLAWSAEL